MVERGTTLAKKYDALQKQGTTSECANPHCEVCRNDRSFEMPNEIIDALISRRLVIFAGAGVSTESLLARGSRFTFYERIRDELGLAADVQPPFPSLMTQFVKANGRSALLQKIKQHLEYGKQFYEVQTASTRFQNELATIPFLDEIYYEMGSLEAV
jgi:hypothetical protein